MKYVKLDLSFGDKLRLLFFGLIPEDKLPEKEVIKEVEKEKVIVEKSNSVDTHVAPPKPEDINNNDEEEFTIPFFDMDDDKDVKSNF